MDGQGGLPGGRGGDFAFPDGGEQGGFPAMPNVGDSADPSTRTQQPTQQPTQQMDPIYERMILIVVLFLVLIAAIVLVAKPRKEGY
jgi:hypothetical protein